MLSTLVISTAFVALSSAVAIHKRSSGQITYYGHDFSFDPNSNTYHGDVPPIGPFGTGACGASTQFGMFANTDNSKYFIALNRNDYNGGQHCGQCIQVGYQGAKAVGKVLDLLPSRDDGLDLSLELFGAVVGGVDKAKQMGVANVDFEFVNCPSTLGPVSGNSDSPTGTPNQKQPSLQQQTPPSSNSAPSSASDSKDCLGFKCCEQKLAAASGLAVSDKFGRKYGWENNQSCLYRESI